uniref:Uncharacterized protein n=1 Tax=Anguilla anguilla TaxID=7936 RepID=A0A0E9S3R9_ANGAN
MQRVFVLLVGRGGFNDLAPGKVRPFAILLNAIIASEQTILRQLFSVNKATELKDRPK